MAEGSNSSTKKFSALDVANWMKQESERQDYLYQAITAKRIVKRFGTKFVYDNSYGGVSINRTVLAEFRKLTLDTLVWERQEQAWRKRRSTDPIGTRDPERDYF